MCPILANKEFPGDLILYVNIYIGKYVIVFTHKYAKDGMSMFQSLMKVWDNVWDRQNHRDRTIPANKLDIAQWDTRNKTIQLRRRNSIAETSFQKKLEKNNKAGVQKLKLDIWVEYKKLWNSGFHN